MKKLFTICILLLTLSSSDRAQETAPNDPYQQAMQRLLKASNMQNMFGAMVSGSINQLRSEFPDVPADYWAKAEERMIGQLMDAFLPIVTPLYQEYFTLEEIEQLIRFHESPVGQKINTAQPQIMAKGSQQFNKTGALVVQELIRDMLQQGYIDQEMYDLIMPALE